MNQCDTWTKAAIHDLQFLTTDEHTASCVFSCTRPTQSRRAHHQSSAADRQNSQTDTFLACKPVFQSQSEAFHKHFQSHFYSCDIRSPGAFRTSRTNFPGFLSHLGGIQTRRKSRVVNSANRGFCTAVWVLVLKLRSIFVALNWGYFIPSWTTIKSPKQQFKP